MGRKWLLHLTSVSFHSDNSQVFQANVLRTRRNSTTVMNRHSLVRELLDNHVRPKAEVCKQEERIK